MFIYLQEWIIKNNSTLFLTTHSNIAIDLYSSCEDTQIFHIDKDADGSKIKKIETYQDKVNILNDLDVRASDILQSNGIIWVEGPSDRIYINKWIELVTGGELKENQHYQIMFYGGKLLSHLEATGNEDITNYINLLLINRNSAIVIDSDKTNSTMEIRSTKRRVKDEFEKLNSLCWITEGKEIENYLSAEIVQSQLESKNRNLNTIFEQYVKIDTYLDNLETGSGKKFTSDKVGYAKNFAQLITRENMENRFDLEQKIKELVKQIKKWNSL